MEEKMKMVESEGKVVRGIADLSDAIIECMKETETEGVMLATIHTLVRAVYAMATHDFQQRSRECVTFVRDFANEFKQGADRDYEEVVENERDSMVQ